MTQKFLCRIKRLFISKRELLLICSLELFWSFSSSLFESHLLFSLSPFHFLPHLTLPSFSLTGKWPTSQKSSTTSPPPPTVCCLIYQSVKSIPLRSTSQPRTSYISDSTVFVPSDSFVTYIPFCNTKVSDKGPCLNTAFSCSAILAKCRCLLILLLFLARSRLWSKALRTSLHHQIGQSGSTQQAKSAVPMTGTGLFQLMHFSSLLPDNELASTTFMSPFSKYWIWVMEMSITTELCHHMVLEPLLGI